MAAGCQAGGVQILPAIQEPQKFNPRFVLAPARGRGKRGHTRISTRIAFLSVQTLPTAPPIDLRIVVAFQQHGRDTYGEPTQNACSADA